MNKNIKFNFTKKTLRSNQKPKDTGLDPHMLEVIDKIKLRNNVENNPPKPGVVTAPLPDGTYAVDLEALLRGQIADCPATIIPMLIDHGVRVAVDIKTTYKPERRHLDFQYWWIALAVMGLGIISYFGGMLMGLW